MKKVINKLGILACGVLCTAAMSSCSTDDPFASSGEGDVRMRLVIKSDVTRADVSDDEELRSNCVVYISNEKGLIHKYQGLENLPENIRMKCGTYVAEAWTGDSVPASFDKKFYRGYQEFTVEQGINSPVLKCGVANVVASVNEATIDESLMKDYKITIGHSNATLDFTADNVADAKGYYMLPSSDTNLTYTISGTNAEGRKFEKTGTILGQGPQGACERAHEYVLNFAYNPEYEEVGGSFITITIDDQVLEVKDEIDIYGCPTISGADFDITRQIIGNEGAIGRKIVKIAGFGDITSLDLSTEDSEFNLPYNNLDLLNLTATPAQQVEDLGITYEKSYREDRKLTTLYLTFSSEYLNALPERDEEYRLTIKATDSNGKASEAVIRIAVGEGAIVIEDPVTVEPVDTSSDLMAITSTNATIYVNIVDPDAEGLGIEYREADSNGAWTFVSIDNAVAQLRRRAQNARKAPATRYSVKLHGLKPGVRYAYRAVANDFQGTPAYFTTETTFTIPNGNMELWSTWADNSKVVLPSGDGQRTFWDSGNHGSATMSKTLTQGSSVMFSSGSKSAELKSQFVGLGAIGKFAAGNIFAGEYKETKGTNGVIDFGRKYDGSHPTALKVMVNYRPGTGVSGKGANNAYIGTGQLDKGQIYVALSTTPVTVDTSNTATLFNPNADCIVAYGQHTFEGNYGADGVLESLEIPIEYYAKAKTTRPLYLIIVCSASKYGDYFSGGEGSTFYLDDFELIY